jgi:PPE-repeat protein
MTAPIWMAAPPEVHSSLLSTGPGPGPLLAAAESWNSLSIVYTETAQELAALLASVQGGAWEGPTAAAYAAAHVPYLAWLTEASVDSAVTAARQETAAAAYTVALATMPTLAELAANHATNAVLAATNFFGINDIPIAVNEADYVRMWIQAATVMTTYQAVATAAVAASPQTTAAPQIEKANPASVVSNLGNRIYNWLESLPLPPDTENEVYQWLENIGFINYWNNYLEPLSNVFFNSPYFQAIFSGFDPYLALLGNPLIFLSPSNIAFALGYPLDIGSYIAFLSETFSFIALDLTAAVATGNPATIGFTILFTTVEAVGTIITDTIALLKTLLEQFIVLLLPVITPLLTPLLAGLAAGTALSPAAGLSGLAALAAIPPPVPPPPILPSVAALVPSIPISTSTPVPAPAELTTLSPTTGLPPPPTPAPPTTSGAGVGMNMGMGMGMDAGMENYGYLVGDLSAVAKRVAGFGARKTAPVPAGAAAAAVAATPREPAQRQRRRRPRTEMLGRGYEYMDLEDEDASAGGERVGAVAASVKGAGTQGFAGTAAKTGAGQAAGLATLADDALGGGPRMPMMPGTWGAEPAPDLPDGPDNR